MLLNKKPTIKNIGSFSIQFLNSTSIENYGYRGISHLVEHCMCEKIKEFEEEFSKYSLSYNAWTSDSGINFYLKGIDKYVNKFKYKFLDAILSYKITEDVFERERNIVIQEYIQNFSSQSFEFFHNFSRKNFNMYGAIGFLDDLKNITYENFIGFKNRYFSVPDYLINVSKYSFKKNRKNKNNINSIKSTPFEIEHDYIYDDYEIDYESYSEFNKNRILMLYTFFNDDDENNYKKFIYYLILCKYMNDGLTSPLYKNIREKLQCVYGINTGIKHLNRNNFMYFTYLMTDEEKIYDVENELIDCYKNIEFDETRFNNIISSIELDYEKEQYFDAIKTEKCEFNKNIEKIIKKMKFNFNDFKNYVQTLQNSNILIINDKKFKEGIKNV